MPKLKTNKAAKKRYSYTATGKVKEPRQIVDTFYQIVQQNKKDN